MRVKINGQWYDANSDLICVELTGSDKHNIANMHPDATKYASFPDYNGLSKEEKLAWMGDEAATSLGGTPRDLTTMEQHVERAEQTALLLWSYSRMKLMHCQDTTTYRQHDTALHTIRQDLGALVSCIRTFQKDQANADQKKG